MTSAPIFGNKQSFLSLRVSDILLFLVANMLIFRDFFEYSVAGVFGYVDELTALIMLAAGLLTVLAKGSMRMLDAKERGLVLCFVLLTILGLISSVVQGIQTSTTAIAIDVLLCNKFIAVLFGGLVIFNNRDCSPLLDMLEAEAKILLPLLCVLACANIFFDFGMRVQEYRYGLTPFKFIFSHPVVVVWVSILFCSVLLRNKRRNMLYIFLGCIAILLTLRSKGICWVAAFAVIILLMREGKLSLPVIVLGAALVVYFAWDQLTFYYSSTGVTTSRGALQAASFKIANEYFPLGAGFATFGSAVTASDPMYYSPLYYSYGINTIWGMTIDSPTFIADTFLPIIFGQFGYIGAVIVTCIFVLLNKIALDCKPNWLSLLALTLYLTLSAFSETSIFQPNAITFAFVMALLITGGKNRARMILDE